MSEHPPTTAEVAADFAALWRSGGYRAAGEKYWADDVVSFGPGIGAGGSDAPCRGVEVLRARRLPLFATHGVEDLSLDGPFVTGDHFALFVDMLMVHAGERTPHCEIAVFTVRDGRIVEERHFHE
jgi:hypothetical protein